MTRLSFARQSRNPRTVLILICIYAVLIGLMILFDAAWWLMAFLALVTLPALWDVIKDTSAGLELSQGFVAQIGCRGSCCASSMIAGRYEHPDPIKVQDHKPAVSQCWSEAAWIAVDLV